MKTQFQYPMATRSARCLSSLMLFGLLALPVLAPVQNAQAATDTWNGGGADPFWGNPTNWTGSTVANGDDLVFAGTTRLLNTNNIVGLKINSLTYNATDFLNIASNGVSLTITNGLTDTVGNNTNNIPLILGGSQTFQNSAGAGVTQLGGTINMSNFSLTIGGTGNLYLNGVVSGNGAVGVNVLNMNGSGILRLAAANTFNGGVNINSGTVQLGNAGGLTSGSFKGYTTIATGATLDLGAQSPTVNGLFGLGVVDEASTNAQTYTITLGLSTNINPTFSGVIQNTYGTVALTKTGTNTQTLSGNNTYLGATTVNQGTLVLSGANSYVGKTTIGNGGDLVLALGGSIASTNIQILPGGLFDSTGAGGFTVSGNIIAGRTSGFTNDILGNLTLNGGNLTPVDGAAATMTILGNLTLSPVVLNFDLNNVPPVGGGTNDLINVIGTLNISGGTSTVKLNPLAGSFGGTYTLITSTNTIVGSAANLAFDGPRGVSVAFDTTTQPSNVLATVTGSPNPAHLVWVGNGSGGAWDVQASQNWTNPATSSLDYFYNLDNVTFDDSATTNNAVVNLPGAVSPTSLTVNNTAVNYTLGASTDPGLISGPGGLTKNGTGTLTLQTANNYTGDTVLNGGTVILGTSLASPNFILYDGVAPGRLVLGGAGLFMTDAANITYQADFNNLTINPGGSSMAMRNRQSSSQYIYQIGSITRNVGGTIDFNNIQSKGASPQVGLLITNSPAVNRILSGWATIFLTDWVVPVATGGGSTALPAGSYQTNANPATWTATTNVSLTVNTSANVNNTTINTLKLSGSTVTINSGQTLTLAAGGLLVPNNGGVSAVNGGTLLGAPGADLVVLQNSLANALTIGSLITDNGGATALTKAGQGTLVLTGNNTYSGVTYINGSTVSGGSGTGPGTIAAGTLQIGSGGTTGGISNSPSIQDNGTLAFDRSDTIGYTVPISGVGGVKQTGAGTTILTADNTFSGPVIIAAGTLQIGNGGSTGSFSNATSVANSGALVINRTGTISYAGAINGIGGSLTVQGGGTVVLGGNNTYSGNTTVSAGTLALGANGTVTNSPVITIAAGATFDTSAAGGIALNGSGNGQVLQGSGQVNGSVTCGGGTRISPAGDGAIGTLTLNNSLTMGGGTLTVDVNGAGSRDLLVVNGNLTLTAGTIKWNNTGSALPNGTYKIMSYSGTLTGVGGNLAVAGFSQLGQIATVSSAIPNEIDVVVSSYTPVNLVWQGDGVANPWDVLTTADWTNSAGAATTYHQDDNVTFNDTSANTTVNLQTGLTPNQMTVNGTVNSYTLQGSGYLAAGAGNLTNNNPNTLTILTTNTSSGTIVINAGTVLFGNGVTAGAIGSEPVLDQGTLAFNEPAGFVVAANGSISGPGFLNVLGGSLVLNANNAAFSGGVLIASGATLQVGLNSASGTLGTGPVTNNGSLVIDSTSTSLNYGGIISGSGTVSNVDVGALTLSGANTYSGETYVTAGTLKVGAVGALPTGPGATNVVVNGGADSTTAGTLDLNGFSLLINGLDGAAGTVVGQVVNNAGSATQTLTVGNADSAGTFSGIISDNTGSGGKITLVKIGTNTETLNISQSLGNLYSGGTIISNGTITITSPGGANPTEPAANNLGLGTGPVTFDGTNGTLSLAGSIPQSTSPTWGNPFANTVNIPAGQVGTINPPQRGVCSPTLTGSGTLYYNPAYVRGEMGGNWSAFTGYIVLAGQGNGGNMGLDAAFGMPNAHLVMVTNVNFYGRMGGTPTIPIGELSGGDSTVLLCSTTPSGAGGQAANFMIGGLNTSTNFGGTIQDNVGLIKVGTGTFTVTNVTYTGLTTVSNGTLLFTTMIPPSSSFNLAAPGVLDISQVGTPLSVGASAGQVIQGNGTLNGSLALGSLGTNNVGFVNAIGTMTITNDANLAGVTDMELNRTNTIGGTNDQLVAQTIELGGVLNVTNIGPALHVGDTFKLFKAIGTLSGTFATVNLATNDANNMAYTWTDNTAVNGSITVLTAATAVNTTPTNITATVSGNVLTLSWPADHTGWRLLVQTNTLANGLNPSPSAWVAVPGSSSVNSTNITINPANSTVFYRLVYP